MEQQTAIQEVDPKKNIVINRRSFFGVLLCVGAAGMGAILAVPVLRYVLYPLYAKSSKGTWSPIGEMERIFQPVEADPDTSRPQAGGWMARSRFFADGLCHERPGRKTGSAFFDLSPHGLHRYLSPWSE